MNWRGCFIDVIVYCSWPRRDIIQYSLGLWVISSTYQYLWRELGTVRGLKLQMCAVGLGGFCGFMALVVDEKRNMFCWLKCELTSVKMCVCVRVLGQERGGASDQLPDKRTRIQQRAASRWEAAGRRRRLPRTHTLQPHLSGTRVCVWINNMIFNRIIQITEELIFFLLHNHVRKHH